LTNLGRREPEKQRNFRPWPIRSRVAPPPSRVFPAFCRTRIA
jgi:hypothetical protein